jgi:hypothetical protein
MPVLDSCVNATFEPGNIGSSIGTTPVIIRVGTLLTPETYDPEGVTYSLNFSRFYNSGYTTIGII